MADTESGITYNAPATVADMLRSRAYVRGIIGPIGSGKSAGCVMGLLKNAMEQTPDPRTGVRNSRMAVIRNTYRMLKDTTLKTVHEWLPPGVAGTWRESTMSYHVKFGDVESEWLFRALDGPDDVRNLLSLELTSAWINEYREIPYDVLINLLGRLGRFPRKKRVGNHTYQTRFRGVILDSNPPPGGSPWHDLFEYPLDPAVEEAFQRAMQAADVPPDERDRPILSYHRQPSGRSPQAENVENLPAGYYDMLVAANAHRGEEWVKVHVDAQYGQDPSNTPVFPEFRADQHGAPGGELLVNPKLPLLIGMDFGRTPAIVVCQHTPEGWWNVLAEFLGRNEDTEQFLERAIPWLTQMFPLHVTGDKRRPIDADIYGDPAGNARSQNSSRTSYEIVTQRGLTIFTGEGKPELRYGAVRRGLTTYLNGRSMLRVDSVRCPVLHKGFEFGYKYAHTREGELSPKPVKNEYSHPHDALQHLMGKVEGVNVRLNRSSGEPGGRNTFPDKPIVKHHNWKVWG